MAADGTSGCSISDAEGSVSWGGLGLATVLVMVGGALIAVAWTARTMAVPAGTAQKARPIPATLTTVVALLLGATVQAFLARWALARTQRKSSAYPYCVTAGDLHFLSSLGVACGVLLGVVLIAIVLAWLVRRIVSTQGG